MARVSYSRTAVSNLPATQPVSGTVSVDALPAVTGTVSVGNFPATQAVSGTVTVSSVTAPDTHYGAVTALLTSAARTATNQSASVTNSTGAIGVILYLRITAASGTGGVSMNMQFQDPIGNTWDNWPGTTAAATANGNYVMIIYPASLTIGSTAVKTAQAMLLPNTWRVNFIHGDASSYTYACSYSLLY